MLLVTQNHIIDSTWPIMSIPSRSNN